MTENEPLHFHYDVDGNNFTSAGEASVQVKRMLRQMGFHPDLIRRISVARYEGEINMVIHAKGGDYTVEQVPEAIYAKAYRAVPFVHGYSTTKTIEKSRQLSK